MMKKEDKIIKKLPHSKHPPNEEEGRASEGRVKPNVDLGPWLI